MTSEEIRPLNERPIELIMVFIMCMTFCSSSETSPDDGQCVTTPTAVSPATRRRKGLSPGNRGMQGTKPTARVASDQKIRNDIHSTYSVCWLLFIHFYDPTSVCSFQYVVLHIAQKVFYLRVIKLYRNVVQHVYMKLCTSGLLMDLFSILSYGP